MSVTAFLPKRLLGSYWPKGLYGQTEAKEQGLWTAKGLKKKQELNTLQTVQNTAVMHFHGFIHLFDSLPPTGLLTSESSTPH